MDKQKTIIYIGSALIVTIGMLVVKGLGFIVTKAVTAMLQ